MMWLSERTYLDCTGTNGIECRHRRTSTPVKRSPVSLQSIRGELGNWDPALLDALAVGHGSVSAAEAWSFCVKSSHRSRGEGSEW
jgi:hypothetical protein